MPARPRLKLRNLDVSQKLLILAVLATVGAGYLAALANLFAQTADADGKATVKLDDFGQVLRQEGPVALASKVVDSMGMQDVIRKYHDNPGGTALAGSLEGSMRKMIVDKLVKSDGDTPENRAQAEQLRTMLVAWTKLPKEDRRRTYEDGCPVDEKTGAALLDKKDGKPDDLSPLVKETFDAYCWRCHKPGGVDETAAKIPLNDLRLLEGFCVEDRGVSPKRLALVTHVHLLGFAVLFAATGLLFSMTDWPRWLRIFFAPFTLVVQLAEIACWWLAKLDPFFAKMIFFLGPCVGIGLLIQLAGTFLDLAWRRPEPPADAP